MRNKLIDSKIVGPHLVHGLMIRVCWVMIWFIDLHLSLFSIYKIKSEWPPLLFRSFLAKQIWDMSFKLKLFWILNYYNLYIYIYIGPWGMYVSLYSFSPLLYVCDMLPLTTHPFWCYFLFVFHLITNFRNQIKHIFHSKKEHTAWYLYLWWIEHIFFF